jgi:hypothetical protein
VREEGGSVLQYQAETRRVIREWCTHVAFLLGRHVSLRTVAWLLPSTARLVEIHLLGTPGERSLL